MDAKTIKQLKEKYSVNNLQLNNHSQELFLYIYDYLNYLRTILTNENEGLKKKYSECSFDGLKGHYKYKGVAICSILTYIDQLLEYADFLLKNKKDTYFDFLDLFVSMAKKMENI